MIITYPNPSRKRKNTMKRKTSRKRRASVKRRSPVKRVVRRKRRAKTVSKMVVYRNAPTKKRRRRSSTRALAVKRPTRRRRNSKPFGIKDSLAMAGGAVMAGIATNLLMNAVGNKLPGAGNPMIKSAYSAVIPLAAGLMLAKQGKGMVREIGKGVAVGGAVVAITTLLNGAKAPATASGTAAYLNNMPRMRVPAPPARNPNGVAMRLNAPGGSTNLPRMMKAGMAQSSPNAFGSAWGN
jgi:hypothetical protein